MPKKKIFIYLMISGCIVYAAIFVPIFLSHDYQFHEVLQRPIIPMGNNSEIYVINNSSCPPDTILVLLIMSAPNNFKERDAIRRTTGHYLNKNSKTLGMFFVGRSADTESQTRIRLEIETYGDIVLLNYLDSYDRLVHKTLYMLNWSVHFCQGVRYVIKVDDDRIVNVPALIDSMEEYSKTNQFFFLGFVWSKRKPERHIGRYSVSYDEFGGDYYPDYCGSSYAFKGEMARHLVSLAVRTPLFRMEDVFFTGILADSLGYKRIHNAGFSDKHWMQYYGCGFKYVIVSGEHTAKEREELWRTKMSPACRNPWWFSVYEFFRSSIF